MWDYYEYAVRLLNLLQDTDGVRVDIAHLRPRLRVRIPVNLLQIYSLLPRAVHRL